MTHTRFLLFFFLIALILPCNIFAETLSAPDLNVVSQLIAQLGDDDYMVRSNAQDVLSSYGSVVKTELENALTVTEDPEIYQRLQFLIKTIPLVWDEPGDEQELSEFIQLYRRANNLSKMIVLEGLRRLPIEIQIKALDRIFQKEQNSGSALFAAMAFWYWGPEPDSPQYAQIAQAVNNLWKDSKNPAVKNLYYLLNYKQLRAEATIWFDNQLQNLVDLSRVPSKSAELIPEYIGTILAEFARRKAESLLSSADLANEKKINFPVPRFGYSSAVIIINGKTQKQFNIRNQTLAAMASSTSVSVRNPEIISVIPLLGPIYLSHLGMKKEAESWLNWELSYREITSSLRRRIFAETLHEYNQNKVAADLLENKISDNNASKKDLQILSNEDKARAAYFRACQASQDNDPDKQWEFLHKSLEADPAELDSIIMQWELCQIPSESSKIPAITDDVRKQVEENIEKLLSKLDKEIATNGFDSYDNKTNQYAWLAVKTNRHLDKALIYAQEAVDANPTSYACIDTQAHVYAANGDLEKAIELQNRAVALNPVSPVLYNSLLKFKELKDKANNERQ